jgi:hypothetical protein
MPNLLHRATSSCVLPHAVLLHPAARIEELNQANRFQPLIKKELIMLYTIAVILIILWLLGMVTSFTMGGFIHILLIIAVVVILLRIISGRRPL